MPSIYDWSATPAENTSVGGVNIAEGCPAANMNDAVRQIMAIVRTTLEQDMRFGGIVTVAPGGVSGSGRLRVLSRFDGNSHYAMTAYSTVNYNAFQCVREINGIASEQGRIFVTDNGTSYNTTSDYRLKKIEGPVTGSGAFIDALKPVQGSWKVNGKPFVGFIAHEVQNVARTEFVTGEHDGPEMQTMDYGSGEMIANLVAELQAVRVRVAELEAR
jgi:hypothetical protein